MSSDSKGKKRKSTDAVDTKSVKKMKSVKSADKPAPLKSALKKTKAQNATTEVIKKKDDKPEKPIEVTSKTVKRNGGTSENNIDQISAEEGKDENGTELTPDQTAALLAGFSSSEEETDREDAEEGIAPSKLPAAPTSEVRKRIKEATEDPEATPGVVYISRIPHGFFEKQMKAYFSQFGGIKHLRLARNKKTGKSKHYAFIEFESAAVADIVAKTMDKYLLFGHILQARRVPSEQIQEGLWKGSNGRGRVMPRNKIEGRKLREGMDREGWEKRVLREGERRKAKAEKLQELGYDFEMPSLKAVNEVPVKPKAIEQAPALDLDREVADLTTPVVQGTVIVDAFQETAKEANVEQGLNAAVEEKATRKRKTSGQSRVKESKNAIKVT